jgi:hypothetical protein
MSAESVIRQDLRELLDTTAQGRVMAHVLAELQAQTTEQQKQTVLLERIVALLEPPPVQACPHLPEWHENRSSMGHKLIVCTQCGEVIVDEEKSR